MRLLILTPSLGPGPYLDEMLADVAALGSRVNHRIVCPGHAVDALRRRAPGAEIVAADRRGVYAALNAGLAARGESWDAFTWINDDDRLDPDGVIAASDALSRLGEGIVYGEVNYCDPRGADLGPLPVERNPARLRALFSSGLPGLSQHGTWVSRAAAEALGSFDERLTLAADFDYWAHAVSRGIRFAHLDRAVGTYRLRPGQLSGGVAEVAAQIALSTARRFPRPASARRWWVRTRFRCEHVPGLIRRWQLTGCVRTKSLHRLVSTQGGNPP